MITASVSRPPNATQSSAIAQDTHPATKDASRPKRTAAMLGEVLRRIATDDICSSRSSIDCNPQGKVPRIGDGGAPVPTPVAGMDMRDPGCSQPIASQDDQLEDLEDDGQDASEQDDDGEFAFSQASVAKRKAYCGLCQVPTHTRRTCPANPKAKRPSSCSCGRCEEMIPDSIYEAIRAKPARRTSLLLRAAVEAQRATAPPLGQVGPPASLSSSQALPSQAATNAAAGQSTQSSAAAATTRAPATAPAASVARVSVPQAPASHGARNKKAKSGPVEWRDVNPSIQLEEEASFVDAQLSDRAYSFACTVADNARRISGSVAPTPEGAFQCVMTDTIVQQLVCLTNQGGLNPAVSPAEMKWFIAVFICFSLLLCSYDEAVEWGLVAALTDDPHGAMPHKRFLQILHRLRVTNRSTPATGSQLQSGTVSVSCTSGAASQVISVLLTAACHRNSNSSCRRGHFWRNQSCNES